MVCDPGVYADFGPDYWNTQNSMGSHLRHPLHVPQVEEDVPNTIRVSYRNGNFDVTRTTDLTWDKLKAEVAREMRCDPRQLMASDVAMVKGRAMLAMSDDYALALCATHIKFRCNLSAESEDDEMEDVQ